MFFRNISARLVTINHGDKKFTQIKPGKNPAVELPDDVAELPFVKLLIKGGILIAEAQPKPVVVEDDGTNLYTMSKGDLKDYAELLDIEVKSAWGIKELIKQIESVTV